MFPIVLDTKKEIAIPFNSKVIKFFYLNSYVVRNSRKTDRRHGASGEKVPVLCLGYNDAAAQSAETLNI